MRLASLVALALAAAPAAAAPCAIDGDPTLIAEVQAALTDRGIDGAACAELRPRLDRDGARVVVSRDDAGVIRATAVDDAGTAATVLESWLRTDLTAPLLEVRALRPAALAPMLLDDRAAAPRPGRPRDRVQVRAAAELGVAIDGTVVAGPRLGACVALGAVCAAAQLRLARVLDDDGPWAHDERTEGELLIGGDIPLTVGRVAVVPGFGGGIGTVATHVESREQRQYLRTGGLRGEAHVAIDVPLGWRLRLTAALAIDLAESTHVETNTTLTFPDQPWATARLGLGLAWGDS